VHKIPPKIKIPLRAFSCWKTNTFMVSQIKYDGDGLYAGFVPAPMQVSLKHIPIFTSRSDSACGKNSI
jgi:hypothetical protein